MSAVRKEINLTPLAGAVAPDEGRRQVFYEVLSGVSGLVLAVFMWGHMVLVGSILTGVRGFDWLAGMLEDVYIAQPTVLVILVVFLLHAAFASRKIPAQLRQRRRMIRLAKDLRESGRQVVGGSNPLTRFEPHVESALWIWQVRTGMLILVLGSFHILLLGLDVFTPLYGTAAGIEASTSMARVAAGLWLPYAVLLVAVEFHASVGLYRLAVKWGLGTSVPRRILRRVETFLLWFFLGLGVLVLTVLAGWLPPPLAFLLPAP